MDLKDLLDAGREAYRCGLDSTNNPYPHGTAAYWNWLAGWKSASDHAEYEDESAGI